MFRPAFLFIGLRYARAKTRHQFISLISLVSTLGIALGMTVLITVLSVVNGFDKEIKKQIFDMISPISINSYYGEIKEWQPLENQIKTSVGITSVAPFVSQQAMISNAASTVPVMLIGILPDQESNVSALAQKMTKGDLDQLQANHFNIIIGSELANQLNVNPGESITIATLQDSAMTTHITPRFHTFHITGIFKAGGGALSFDSKMAFIHLQDAQKLSLLGNAISGFHVNLTDPYTAPAIANFLQQQLSPDLHIWDWTDQLGDFFENIRMTKTMMFFIFILIIAVAVFNLISTMIMVVKNKQPDIAILRTLGATPGTILAIFLVQGAAIACSGILLGMVGGIMLAENITAISTWVQTILHTEIISANVYFVNYLPSEIQWQDIGFISLAAFLLGLIAVVYPAWNASRLDPVQGLNGD